MMANLPQPEIKLGGSPEEEILALEKKLEDKKRELAERGEEISHEKEVLREVLKEHIKEEQTSLGRTDIPHPTITTPVTGTPQTKPQAKKDEERREELHALVEFALTRSIGDAVRIAEKESPYLLDELHDHLVDDYYDRLVALRKIKKL